MGWRDLLHNDDETITLPWTGSRELRSHDRVWTIAGDLPREHGWYQFKLLKSRTAVVDKQNDPQPTQLDAMLLTQGYLVGDRLLTDDVYITLVETGKVLHEFAQLERVHLIFEDLERFVRVRAGRIYAKGPLIFQAREMPLGPEDDVARAFEDRTTDVNHVKGVSPGLDAAFRLATWQREQAEARRAELERLRLEEEAKRAAEERRQGLIKQLGDGAGRRALAKIDFETAARAALAVGGADLLDWRKARNEHVITYRLNGRRFQCTCDNDLRIVEAGICLVDHRTGRADDKLLTLESLPGVVTQAEREGKLVVFRHV